MIEPREDLSFLKDKFIFRNRILFGFVAVDTVDIVC